MALIIKSDHLLSLFTNSINSNLPLLNTVSKSFLHKNIKKSKPKEKEEDKKSSLKDIYTFIKPYYKSKKAKVILSSSVLITFLSKGFCTASPFFLKRAVNSMIKPKFSPPSIIKYFILAYGAKILSEMLNEFKNFQFALLNKEIYTQYSKEIIDHLTNIPYTEFKENAFTIINSIDKCGNQLYRVNRVIFPQLISLVFEFAMICISLNNSFGRKYVITNIFTYYLYLYFSAEMSKIRKKYFKDRINAEIKTENKFNDIVTNMSSVKYFQAEEFEKKNYLRLVKDEFKTENKIVTSLAFLNTGQSMINNCCIMTNMIIGLRDYMKNRITIGDFFMLQGLFSQMLIPLHIIGFVIREIEETKIQFKSGTFLRNDYKKTLRKREKDTNERKNLKFKQGVIKFENVCFTYNNSVNKNKRNENINGNKLNKNPSISVPNPVIKNLSFTFFPGRINCIVGESGQGKSTIFNLIYKMLKPGSGKIYIDGQDINTLDTESVRDHLTICTQGGSSLLNESLLYNIMYGVKEENYQRNLKRNLTKMKEILEKINLYDKINFWPEKFEMKVGTSGSKLSEGEKQRILFCRALMKDKYKILLLDEPTSSLDTQNVTNIFELINKARNDGLNVVMITHKLGLAKFCDKIFVMKGGR
ncbi:MAG: ABC transporter ATP-binding protein/permease, partial [archaeon]|nr:ABC transporter ATP-binding protein/permease [archaeon]